MTHYLPEVEAIAREAGALLMGYFAGHVTIEYKGDVDLVTEADRASEKMIVERLRSRWPEHGIVGEVAQEQRAGFAGNRFHFWQVVRHSGPWAELPFRAGAAPSGRGLRPLSSAM